jgi:COMPASS component SWD2
MILTEETIKKFKASKSFKDNNMVHSLSFLYNGESVAHSSVDTLRICSPLSGTLKNVVSIKNINKVEYLFPNTILHTCDNTIKYLSLYDNQYLRSFNSHVGTIKSLSSNILNDTFISSSDESTYIWDLKIKKPLYSIKTIDSVSAFSMGDGFCLSVSNVLLKLYDARNILYGPRKTITLQDIIGEIKRIQYSPNGKYISASGKKTHLIFEVESGQLYHRVNTEKEGDMCFTPDSKYVFCSSGGIIYVHDLINRKKIHHYSSYGLDIKLLEFNPVYSQFVSASTLFTFWMPEVKTENAGSEEDLGH